MSTLTRESLPVAGIFAEALRGVPCDVIWADGTTGTLPVAGWVQVADGTDRSMLASCAGPTIDIGCGPGRMSAQLMLDGHVTLGIDVAPEAITQTRARGVNALRRDVFGRVPGVGSWQTALLADGNIGIGGDPVRLLERVRELVCPTGIVVVELAAYGEGLRRSSVALRVGDRVSDSFPWALVGADAVAAVAARAGLTVVSTHERGGRWWSILHRES
ncbi:class I SAM-dependent methyltransferase [Nocardioides sp. B-3]|uniref:class I SAM-dependent methyltransferase n=1 Tax=Nocardioides sp. B-3 TaxID=2895565 RepID=UPI0021535E01|nr:class I SAM-dependent methyltransferase [Nocardioides sp. B-3]UUZ59310.1 class I SAM-dependent methyltransferase [Nocardioides sp. B-3]